MYDNVWNTKPQYYNVLDQAGRHASYDGKYKVVRGEGEGKYRFYQELKYCRVLEIYLLGLIFFEIILYNFHIERRNNDITIFIHLLCLLYYLIHIINIYFDCSYFMRYNIAHVIAIKLY